MTNTTFKGLPVHGYKPQDQTAVGLVNINKEAEESLLRMMDDYAEMPPVDKRWLAIARTSFEQGFMALNRSIFKPGRIALPDEVLGGGK